MSSSQRPPGEEHIPPYPNRWVSIRTFQLFLSFIEMILSAYGTSFISGPAPELMLSTSVVTFGVSIWLVVAHSHAPRAFNYWAVLTLDILLLFAWLASTIMMAADAADLFVMDAYGDDDDGYQSGFFRHHKTSHHDLGLHAYVLAIATGLGTLQFLLFFIAWVTDAVVISRHRKAGLHSKPLKKRSSIPMELQPKTACEGIYHPSAPFKQTEMNYSSERMGDSAGVMQMAYYHVQHHH